MTTVTTDKFEIHYTACNFTGDKYFSVKLAVYWPMNLISKTLPAALRGRVVKCLAGLASMVMVSMAPRRTKAMMEKFIFRPV